LGPIEGSGRIIKALKGSPVLTVSETDGFLESGEAQNQVETPASGKESNRGQNV
jgi:hypothetical protein